MILVVGKKAKQKIEPQADREMAIEAAYFARKFGLTKEEALKTIKEAGVVKLLPSRNPARTR